MALGHLVVFRKGKSSAPYELDEGEHSIGSSLDSNIRLKFTHPLLLETHALIRVSRKGIATVINKSVGAPVRVNGKVTLKPTILRHEDKFEILEKIFQYFNENLKDEPIESGKFVKEQKTILAKGRQSVNPLVKTPAKKSNIKTKVSSIRKSMSAVSRPSKGLQVVITPNKKPDRHIGSKTTSKIIVSKALVSPRSAKKRRLSLDNGSKTSKIPKISSRNILLSKSTINITISEEHEYSEITPSTQEESSNVNGKTPRRSIKLENTVTPNKKISVDLIDFNSPTTLSVNPPRRPSGRKASLSHQSVMDNTSNVMKTPINKRIQSLKTVRHSLKKDTPPPKFTLPSVRIQPATPQSGNKGTDVSVTGDNDDISISYSPNAEPSSSNLTPKENKTPRRSITRKYEETSTAGNMSRVSFAIEAPSEASPINLEAINESDFSIDEENEFVPSEKDNSINTRKSGCNEESSASRRSNKYKESLAATEEVQQNLEMSKSRSSLRYSLDSTKKLDDSLPEVRNEEAGKESLQNETRKSRAGSVLLTDTPDSDKNQDYSTRKSFRNRVVSASTDGERLSINRNSEKRSLNKSQIDVAGHKSFSQSSHKPLDDSRSTLFADSKIQNDSFLSENDMLAEPLQDSSADEMDELQIPDVERSNESLTRSNVEENISRAQEKSLNTSKNISTRSSSASNFGSSLRVSSSQPSRTSRNVSIRKTSIELLAEPFQTEDNATHGEPNTSKTSRLSRSISSSSTQSEKTADTFQNDIAVHSEDTINGASKIADYSQAKDVSTDAEEHVNNTSQVPNISRRSCRLNMSSNFQTEDNKTVEDNVNVSSRTSGNTSRRSTKQSENVKVSRSSRNVSTTSEATDGSTDSSQTEDIANIRENANKSSRVSRNISKRSYNFEAPAESSQTENNDSYEHNINKSSRVSRNLSRESIKLEALSSSSQTDSSFTNVKENVNESSRASINTSGRTSKIGVAADHSETDDKTTDEENNTSQVPNISRRSFRLNMSSNFQTEDNKTVEDNVNVSSGTSGNTSRRSTKQSENVKVSRSSRNVSTTSEATEGSTDSSRTEYIANIRENANESSRVSRNISKRSYNFEAPAESSQTENNDSYEHNINKSSRVSRNLSRESIKLEALSSSSQTDSSFTNVKENVNESSRASINTSGRTSKIGVAADHSETDDKTTDEEDTVNKSSRLSRNALRRSKMVQESAHSYNTNDLEEKDNKSHKVLRNTSKRSKNVDQLSGSLSSEDNLTYAEKTVNKSIRSVPRRSGRAINSQSSIDSAETTMDIQQENGEETNVSISAKNRSRQRLSIFDESTQEAKPKTDISTNRSNQRTSIFDEPTIEALQKDTSKTMKPISILEDTQEVLSPVRPLSPRKSIRNIHQHQDLEGSISPSTRVSSIRKSRTKNQTSQDSSLTSTSMDQSSSSVISVSSQSFSSFKRGSSERNETETEIDVVNISSTMESREVKSSLRASSFKVKSKALEESNTSRSSKRQTRTSEMFKDVSCTSTPFHKNLSKRSDNGTILESKRQDLISISSSNDSVFMSSTEEKNMERSEVFRRTSSRRSSISKHGGEHNCISCNNSSLKRSRSLSATMEPTVTQKVLSASPRPSKTPRKSTGAVLGTSSNMATPLLHRKSLATSLSDKTPEKAPDTEDETPKSSIKPARRSSKTNQSVYNPLLEDITPVTPEKLTVSGFTEDVFKTPINTPGLFENIRKSVIRSRKRHRESTGSTMKDSKRARVDFTQDEQVETPEVRQYKPQRSPVNRLSNFEGVKKLMKTPPKSPKNDLANVTGVKEMFIDQAESPKRQPTPRKSLAQVPDLKRIVSPRQQNLKNKSRSSVDDKQLAKTPKVQKEPINDLTNISGVSNMFNVSGVEVLHPGSDIENSEDLFTQLTGKRTVKAYPRGKSLSPNKSQQEQAHSRKTMGDIPVCSPRVQQWVEDHANVMYTSMESVPITPLHKDELINVSTKPKYRSKSGRSVSPKKHLQEKTDRRKTQGDFLGDSPNVAAWKAEKATQVKTRKSSSKQLIVKAVILSPNPVETLQLSGTTAEKITPRQSKSKAELLTAHQTTLLDDNTVPANIKAGRGRRRKVNEEQQEGGNAQQLKTETATPQQQIAPLVNNSTPASIKAAILRARKVAKEEEQEVTPQQQTSAEPQKQLSNRNTPASTKTKRGRSKKEINDQPQIETLQLPKPTEEKSTPHKQISTLNDVTTPASVKAKRGRPKNVPAEKASNKIEAVTSSTQHITDKLVTEDEPQQDVSETPKDKNKQLEAVRRGRSKRILSNEELDMVSSTTTSPVQQQLTKIYKTRRGKVASQSEPILEDMEVKVAPTSRTRRAQKMSETEPIIAELEVKMPAKGRQIKIKIDNSESVSASPVRKGGRRGKKAEEIENELINEKRDVVLEENEDTHKPARKVVKKNVEVENVAEVPEVKKVAAKGKRAQKMVEQNQIDIVEQNQDDTKKLPSRRGKKVESTEKKDVADEIPKAEVKQLARKGRRGKKEEELEEPEIKPTRSQKDLNTISTPDYIEEPVLKKTTRSRKRQDVEKTEEKETEPKVMEVKLRGRGQKKPIQDEATDDNTDTEVEFNKRPTRGRAKKGELEAESTEVVPETKSRGRRGAKVAVSESEKSTKKSGKVVKTEETPEFVESPKKPPTRNRNKKVYEPQTTEGQAVLESSQEQNTRKLRNKVIEEIIEMDVDSPRTARAKRGINKKYSTDEYEVTDNKYFSKRKVHFEDDVKTAEAGDTRKSKRTKK